jgi:hypothetical protein
MNASLTSAIPATASSTGMPLEQYLFANYFRGHRHGTFLDIGAGNGRRQSRSLFFEQQLGWHGLCVEPDAENFSELVLQRSCPCERARVADGVAQDLTDVPVRELGWLLQEHGLKGIDYCALDTGGTELAALGRLDLQRFRIRLLSLPARGSRESSLRRLAEWGYEFVEECSGQWVFKRPDVRRLAQTSVICAVWHGDAERAELLAGHAANLAAQSSPVEPIYVFDGADEPPRELAGRKVVVHDSVTIYQAWNVALALVATPFVMNLNLDDRLAPDAVERLESELQSQGAALAAGDWRVCYSQTETDAVERCFPAERLPYVSEWPPPPGARTRLGTDVRATLGPATLWRMDTHIGAPRYPWRLSDGCPLRIAGDAGWWEVVGGLLKKKIVRVPEVIGNYHSHPASQAEFRSDTQELELLRTVGLSLL